MARCALLFPTVGLDLAAKMAGAQCVWALDMYGGLIDRMLRANHKDLAFYGDPASFPFSMTDEELKCDLWVTSNALGTMFALKKVAHRGALPSVVVAKVGALIEVPAFMRAWFESGLFSWIEWASEDVRLYGTPVRERQVFLIGALKDRKPLDFGPQSETPSTTTARTGRGLPFWTRRPRRARV
jgi:hypothetical protein